MKGIKNFSWGYISWISGRAPREIFSHGGISRGFRDLRKYGVVGVYAPQAIFFFPYNGKGKNLVGEEKKFLVGVYLVDFRPRAARPKISRGGTSRGFRAARSGAENFSWSISCGFGTLIFFSSRGEVPHF